jgi:pimeloyl-ACP methyl ester carboxylesterase
MVQHHVVLVPGFFGFARFGELTYFNGVRAALERSFAELGLGVSVIEVETLPTASIRWRAARVLETLVRVTEAQEGPVHLIGHSTGGLDARLALAPTASLPTAAKLRDYERVKTLVTVCCPHFGTPVATYFTRPWGRFQLRAAARYLIFMLERGRLPLSLLLRVGRLVIRARDPFKKRVGTFDELYAKLLDDLSDERRTELVHFLRAISSEDALLFQLTPAGCDLLNACTAEPRLRYGSVIARANPPTFGTWVRASWDLYAQIMYPLFALLHRICRRGERKFIPEPAAPQREKLLALAARPPSETDSDGVVPTHSQLWGSLVHVAESDHLDVVGQYGFRDGVSWAGDWLPSYSGFDRDRFDALWRDVARFIAGGSAAPEATHERMADAERTGFDPGDGAARRDSPDREVSADLRPDFRPGAK